VLPWRQVEPSRQIKILSKGAAVTNAAKHAVALMTPILEISISPGCFRLEHHRVPLCTTFVRRAPFTAVQHVLAGTKRQWMPPIDIAK
jgi:hypothetical protein